MDVISFRDRVVEDYRQVSRSFTQIKRLICGTLCVRRQCSWPANGVDAGQTPQLKPLPRCKSRKSCFRLGRLGVSGSRRELSISSQARGVRWFRERFNVR